MISGIQLNMSYNETFKVIPVYEPYDRFVFCSKPKSNPQQPKQQDSLKGKVIENVYYNGETSNAAYSPDSIVDLDSIMKIEVTDSKPKKTLVELVKANRKPKRKKLDTSSLSNYYSPINKQFFDYIKRGLIEVVKCVLTNGADILPIPIQRCHQDILSLIRQRETNELMNQVYKLIEEHFQSIQTKEKILDLTIDDLKDSELDESTLNTSYKINKNFYKDFDNNSDFDLDEVILTNIRVSNFLEILGRWQSTINLINYIFLPFVNNTNHDSNRQNKSSIKEFGMRLFLDEFFQIKSKSVLPTISYDGNNLLEVENLFDINTQNNKSLKFNYLIFDLLRYHLMERKEIKFEDDRSFSVVSKQDPITENLNSLMKILIEIQVYVNNNVKDSNNFKILRNFQLILIKTVDEFKNTWIKDANLNYFNNSRMLISSITALLEESTVNNFNIHFTFRRNTIKYFERRLIYDNLEDKNTRTLFGKIFESRNDNAEIYKDEEKEKDDNQGIFIPTINALDHLSKEEVIKIYNVYQLSRIEKITEDLVQFIDSNSSVYDNSNILNNSILPNDLKIIDYFLFLIKKEYDLKLIFRFHKSKSEIHDNLKNSSVSGFLDKNYIKIFEKLISNNSQFDNIFHDKLLKYIHFYINNIYNPKKFDQSNISFKNQINNDEGSIEYDDLLILNIFEDERHEIFSNQNINCLIQCNDSDNDEKHIENLINFFKTTRFFMKSILLKRELFFQRYKNFLIKRLLSNNELDIYDYKLNLEYSILKLFEELIGSKYVSDAKDIIKLSITSKLISNEINCLESTDIVILDKNYYCDIYYGKNSVNHDIEIKNFNKYPKVNLPVSKLKEIELFNNKFKDNLSKNKSLNWNYLIQKINLEINFEKNISNENEEENIKIVECSIYQFVILMVFLDTDNSEFDYNNNIIEDKDNISLKDLKLITGIEDSYLKDNLKILTNGKYKVLKYNSTTKTFSLNYLMPNDDKYLLKLYNLPTTLVNLNSPPTSSVRVSKNSDFSGDGSGSTKDLESLRQRLLAFITRRVKFENRITHLKLISEVVTYLEQHKLKIPNSTSANIPTVPAYANSTTISGLNFIKELIEQLINEEFITRDTEADEYIYVP